MLIYQRALSKWVGGHPKHSYKCWNQTWFAGKSSMKFRDVSGHVSEDRRENLIGFVQSRNNLWITTEKSKSPFWQVKSYQIPLNHHFGRWNLKLKPCLRDCWMFNRTKDISLCPRASSASQSHSAASRGWWTCKSGSLSCPSSRRDRLTMSMYNYIYVCVRACMYVWYIYIYTWYIYIYI